MAVSKSAGAPGVNNPASQATTYAPQITVKTEVIAGPEGATRYKTTAKTIPDIARKTAYLLTARATQGLNKRYATQTQTKTEIRKMINANDPVISPTNKGKTIIANKLPVTDIAPSSHNADFANGQAGNPAVIPIACRPAN
jgi:hypothetical protein